MGDHSHQTSAYMKSGSRAFVLLAFVLVLGLGGWRAASIMTTPQAAPQGSQLETTSLGLLETVTGKGHVRLSIRHGAGVKTWLVLINGTEATGTPELAGRVRNLLIASGHFDPASDTLNVRQYPFAPGILTQPSMQEFAELSIFACLAGVLGFAALARRQSIPAPAPRQAAPKHDPIVPQTLERASVQPVVRPRERAAVRANADPSRAAEIVRGWMREPGDAA